MQQFREGHSPVTKGIRDPMAADPVRVPSGEAPTRGVKRRFEQSRPTSATPGRPTMSPRCSSPCPSFVEASTAVPSDRVINADACRSSLGDRTFAILRKAMLQQQEIFLEQLWELHKLARTQGRKAALLAAEAQLPVPTEAQAFAMNPQEQVHLHNMTMQAILNMQSIPASLRRPVAVASPDLTKSAPASAVSEPSTAPNAPAAEARPPPAVAQMHLNQQASPEISNSAFPSQMMMCPLGMNMQYGQQGIPSQAGFGIPTDPSAVSLHWPGAQQYAGPALPAFHPGAVAGFGNMAQVGAPYLQGLPSGPLGQCVPTFSTPQAQGGAPEPAHTQSPVNAQPSEVNARQTDVSSFLGMVVPGMGAQPDLHSQWFAKNMGGSSTPPDMSAAFMGIQTAMDTAPTLPAPENVYASESALSNPSNSLFSGNTLVMGPQMPPVHGQLGYLNDKGIPGSLPISSAEAPAFVRGFVAEQAHRSDGKANSAGVIPARSAEAAAIPKDAVRNLTQNIRTGKRETERHYGDYMPDGRIRSQHIDVLERQQLSHGAVSRAETRLTVA